MRRHGAVVLFGFDNMRQRDEARNQQEVNLFNYYLAGSWIPAGLTLLHRDKIKQSSVCSRATFEKFRQIPQFVRISRSCLSMTVLLLTARH